jgi:hypothetical protein
MKSRFTVLGALVGIALVVTACGVSGDDSSSRASGDSSGTPTKAEFIKRADQICEQVDDTQKAALRSFFANHPNLAETQSVNEELVQVIGVPPLQAEARQWDALPVPAGDEEEIQAIMDGMKEAVEKAEDDPSVLANLKTGAGPFAVVGKLAREYGFKACALPL